MKADGTPETFAEVADWLKRANDALNSQANALHISSDFDELQARAIYGAELAKLCSKAIYRLAVMLDEQSKGGKS